MGSLKEPATRRTKDGELSVELLNKLAASITIPSMKSIARMYLGISQEDISRMQSERKESGITKATRELLGAWSNRKQNSEMNFVTEPAFYGSRRNVRKGGVGFNQSLVFLKVPTAGSNTLRDKGGSEGSCICEADWSPRNLALLKLLEEEDDIKLSIRIDQDIEPKMDLKLILTGVEESRNQAIFMGRLCNHYDLKIRMNLDMLDGFPNEKKEKTILPLSPADSPKSLRSCCEGLAEGPDPHRVAAAYSFVLQKAYKEYTGLKISGASAMLQLPDSDVTIHIPEGVHGVLLAHAHTHFQPFREFVPESECFISPVAEVQYISRDQNEKPKMFMICIPHNVEDKEAWANIQVRRVDIYKNAPSALVPRTDYKVDENFIKVLTKTLAQFVCSVPGCPQECTGTAQAFLFGNSYSFILYACNPLYNLEAFRRALIAKESATKDKRELLKQSDMKWDPEVMDERQYIKVLFTSATWNPRLRSDQEWDENSRTVMQIVPVRNLPSLSRCHGCRLNPTCIAEFDFRLPEGSSFPPFTGELKVVPQGEREKPILEFFL